MDCLTLKRKICKRYRIAHLKAYYVYYSEIPAVQTKNGEEFGNKL